jgi:hypothetical protein
MIKCEGGIDSTMCSGNLIFYFAKKNINDEYFGIRCEWHFRNLPYVEVVTREEYEAGTVISQ